MFTDGSRLDDGATGHAVVWKNGQTWEVIKVHMGYIQEAYDAECAAIARALDSVTRGYVPERVTIFTDAQAAIKRMASENPAQGSSTPSGRGNTSPHCVGPGQVSPPRSGDARLTRA